MVRERQGCARLAQSVAGFVFLSRVTSDRPAQYDIDDQRDQVDDAELVTSTVETMLTVRTARAR